MHATVGVRLALERDGVPAAIARSTSTEHRARALCGVEATNRRTGFDWGEASSSEGLWSGHDSPIFVSIVYAVKN